MSRNKRWCKGSRDSLANMRLRIWRKMVWNMTVMPVRIISGKNGYTKILHTHTHTLFPLALLFVLSALYQPYLSFSPVFLLAVSPSCLCPSSSSSSSSSLFLQHVTVAFSLSAQSIFLPFSPLLSESLCLSRLLPPPLFTLFVCGCLTGSSLLG